MSGFGGKHPHSPNQGATDEWWTPPEIFEALGLEFDLDPCAPPLPAAPWIPAKYRHSLAELGPDGLGIPWIGRVWLNPPYGRETARWMDRLAEHAGSRYEGDEGIALVFSRTDVKWWHDVVPKASAVCFIRGRLTFIAGAGQSAPSNSGGPSALIAFGDKCADAVLNCGLGIVYETPRFPSLVCPLGVEK